MRATSTLSPTADPARVVIKPAGSRLTPAEPSLLERAEALRDAVLKSKLSHPNPWHYTSKARAWVQRAQRVVDDIAAGKDPDTCRQALEALAGEVEGDVDFQEARQLF
jgi:hypothetical protein